MFDGPLVIADGGKNSSQIHLRMTSAEQGLTRYFLKSSGKKGSPV